jgi:pyruvate/2-oxoglutarate dehydrogenase complex dihydrolipoamide acyltransferase (E2) component
MQATKEKKPGLTLYLLRAFALALKEQPAVAGFLIGAKVVHPRSFDIGVAVAVEDGVLVPVIRQVDAKSLSELVKEYDDLVDRARRRRLTDADTKGGIATVTNFGTFGLTWGTPIPLPNETLILGIGAGVKKPVWSPQVEVFLPATVINIGFCPPELRVLFLNVVFFGWVVYLSAFLNAKEGEAA